jgi:hypothetical protein
VMSVLSRTQVFKWFKKGREELGDDQRPGRPCASKRDANIEKVGVAKFELSRTVCTTDTSYDSFWMTSLHCSMFVARHHDQLGKNPACLFKLFRSTTCINYLLLDNGQV